MQFNLEIDINRNYVLFRIWPYIINNLFWFFMIIAFRNIKYNLSLNLKIPEMYFFKLMYFIISIFIKS